jgi:hypothetical protein
MSKAADLGMDVQVIDDKCGEPLGVSIASKCNYFWYDAENSYDDELVHPQCPDYWYYGLRDLTNCTGSVPEEEDPYAHGVVGAQKAWKCSENVGDSAGYAVEFLGLKHINRTLPSQIVYQDGIIDTFFFDFAVKFDTTGYSYSENTEVCTLKVMVQDTLNNHIPLILHPVEGANYDTVLTVGTLVDNSIFPEYTYYQFYTAWDDFPESIKLYSDRLHYLFFQIYWNGIGDLYIDGMQIEDNFYRKLKNGEYDDAITLRMDDFTGYDNINHFYGYDEPQAPQFESFREIKKLLYKKNMILII